MEENKDLKLTKEQILECSRKENLKNGDERQRDKQKIIPAIGFLVGIVALFVVEIIFVIMDKPISHLLAIMSTMLAAQSIGQACVLKRLRVVFIVCAVITTIAAIMQWVMFGLQLANIDF
ncbi:MAG: hypothetical protein J1F36_03990 [Clostridiales bacterium]|nr:hypothetical protein [Clostridiales bacterium]